MHLLIENACDIVLLHGVMLCQRLFEISEDMLQILQTLRYFSQRIQRLKVCSAMLLPALNPAFSSILISSAWGLSLFKLTLNDFARITDEADSSVVLAELYLDLL